MNNKETLISRNKPKLFIDIDEQPRYVALIIEKFATSGCGNNCSGDYH